jgi:integrase
MPVGYSRKGVLAMRDQWNQFISDRLRMPSEHTRRHYRETFDQFEEFLGREPELADLCQPTVQGFASWLASRNLAYPTINLRLSCIRSFWTWCAKLDRSMSFPTIQALREPSLPRTIWTKTQLRQLWEGCKACRGNDGGVPIARQWLAFHEVAFSTGERTSALRQLRWDWLDLDGRTLMIPAEYRKGKLESMTYALTPDATFALLRIRDTSQHGDLVWPYIGGCNERTYYRRYRALLREANLPHNKSGIQRMRRTALTTVALAGLDATKFARHSSPRVTERYYVNPQLLDMRKYADALGKAK